MSSDNASKINKVLKKWVPGTVITLSWLKEQGVYQQLAYRYVKTKWLENIGHGAFIRSGDKVFWDGALFALEFQLKLEVHISGITALALQGRSQQLNIGDTQVVNISSKNRIPAWFKNRDWGAQIQIKNGLLVSPKKEFYSKVKVNGNFLVTCSCVELAILEYIEGVKDESSFTLAYELMEGMVDVRSKIIQNLLEGCSSIKTKRIFLFLAESLNLPFFSKLNFSKIILGTGKRLIIKKGIYDAKYAITVPKYFKKEENTF